MLRLYLTHRRELVSYASAIVGDPARAEDVVQEAWIRFAAVAHDRLLDQPVGYLYRTVRNLAVDGRRRLQREAAVMQAPPRDLPDAIADRGPSPEACAAASDDLRLLAAAIAELPERTRVALEMRRLRGARLKEIAEHLGVSVTVAHGLVADGIAHCRRRVRPSPPR